MNPLQKVKLTKRWENLNSSPESERFRAFDGPIVFGESNQNPRKKPPDSVRRLFSV